MGLTTVQRDCAACDAINCKILTKSCKVTLAQQTNEPGQNKPN